jgi:hypothetical protein
MFAFFGHDPRHNQTRPEFKLRRYPLMNVAPPWCVITVGTLAPSPFRYCIGVRYGRGT